jgi:hypothetical protein
MGVLDISKLSSVGVIPGGFVPSDVPQVEADALIWLYDNTDGDNWTDNTNWKTDPVVNNWYGITVAGGHVTYIYISANGSTMSGDISSFAINDLSGLLRIYLQTTDVSGDISGWTFPSTLEHLLIYNTNVSGDISNWTLTADFIHLQVYDTNVNGAPDINSVVTLRAFYYHDCGLSQADVDAVCLSIYTNRTDFTYSAPVLLIHGTNSTPSGIYQDGDPPTTGKEYIYEIENDPEVEGFNKWDVTYTL